jgi:hypothetical protein
MSTQEAQNAITAGAASEHLLLVVTSGLPSMHTHVANDAPTRATNEPKVLNESKSATVNSRKVHACCLYTVVYNMNALIVATEWSLQKQ